MHWIALHWSPSEAGPAVVQGVPGAPPTASHRAELPDAEALGWWALQFTPHVAWCDEALMLEVSACERLWGGRQALMRQMAASAPEGLRPRQVQGASSLVALARLRLYLHDQQPPARLPDALPLWTLGAAQPHLKVLARLGCQTWGDAAALPRAGLVRRFGTELREALDVAWGLRPERRVWLVAPEVFDQRAELPALATTGPELLWSAQRLLGALRLWLQARQRGVLALALEWTLDLKRLEGVDLPRTQKLLVRTAEPVQEMTHLRRLLAERLAQVTLLAPTGWLRLRSEETAPWGGAARSLLPPRRVQGPSGTAEEAWDTWNSAPGEPLHHLVEKLSARLGPQAVQVPVPQADHRPERMQAWVPAVRRSDADDPPAAATPAVMPMSALLPTWLLPEPLPLEVQGGRPHYHGPLDRLVGPQRLEGDGWWEQEEEGASADWGDGLRGAAVARDYYIARSPQAGLVWIYRERTTLHSAGQAARWFLQGFYA